MKVVFSKRSVHDGSDSLSMIGKGVQRIAAGSRTNFLRENNDMIAESVNNNGVHENGDGVSVNKK